MTSVTVLDRHPVSPRWRALLAVQLAVRAVAEGGVSPAQARGTSANRPLGPPRSASRRLAPRDDAGGPRRGDGAGQGDEASTETNLRTHSDASTVRPSAPRSIFSLTEQEEPSSHSGAHAFRWAPIIERVSPVVLSAS